MRKIHEIFKTTKELPETVVHWTQVHGNLLLKSANSRFFKGHIERMIVHLRGAGTKSYPDKKEYRVYFDRSFLVAKFFLVIKHLHDQRIKPEDIKSLMDEALATFYSELEKQDTEESNEPSN